jgi:hypothetical protein
MTTNPGMPSFPRRGESIVSFRPHSKKDSRLTSFAVESRGNDMQKRGSANKRMP